MTGQVKQTPGSIGYVELAYAKQNKLPMAALKNAAGKFVKPIARDAPRRRPRACEMPRPTSASRSSNAPGEDAYPIASFTYMLVYEEQADAAKGKALAELPVVGDPRRPEARRAAGLRAAARAGGGEGRGAAQDAAIAAATTLTRAHEVARRRG